MSIQDIRGFSLIELMVVLVIIAIIVAIAVPNYQGYLADGRRADGQGALMSLANALERNFTETGRYNVLPNGSAMNITTLFGTDTVGESSTYYTLTFDDADGNTLLTRTAYTIHAAPSGVQTGDRCGRLSLTSTGVRDAIKDGASVAGCWR